MELATAGRLIVPIAYLAVAALVLCLPKEMAGDGGPGRWWRSPRAWSAVVLAVQALVYLVWG